MKTEEVAILTQNYFDATDTIRHYDNLRSSFSGLAVSGLSLLAGFATHRLADGENAVELRLIAAICLAISIISILILFKFSHLISRQRLRARASANLLSMAGLTCITQVDDMVREESIAHHRLPPLSILWTLIFLAFALLSLYALIWEFLK
jgi:hypothetical protein